MSDTIVIGLHAHLDPETEAAIVAACEAAEERGIGTRGWNKTLRPHMTMGSWYVPSIDQDAFDRMTRRLCGLGSFPLRLSFMASVRERLHINLCPVVQHELLRYHERVHEALGSDTPPNHQRDIDLPGQWVPHVSVMDCADSDLPAVMPLIRSLGLPRAAHIRGFGFASYRGGEAPRYVSAGECEQARESGNL